MADEEIEWLDEPALPASSQDTLARRPRRPVVLVVGMLAAIGIVVGALLTGGGDSEVEPTPAAITTVTSSPIFLSSSIPVPEFHDAPPGLLRAVAGRFHGADLTSTGVCVSEKGGSYGFTARGLAIQLDIGCGVSDENTDIRGPHQITVNGPKARVSITSTPRRVLTERDFTAAEQLIADERVVS